MKHVLSKCSLIAGALAWVTVAQAGPSASAGMGKGLYTQTGANSCLYCHGADGMGGNVAAAAKLAQPKTWKAWKALGGDAAYAANKAEFLAHLKEATVALIKSGAVRHNVTFKPAWFDKTKLGGPYNAQMMGLSGAPSKKWLKKYEDKGVTDDVAAESSYLYVQSLDTQGIFK